MFKKFRHKKITSKDTASYIANMTRIVFGEDAALSGKTLKDIPDEVLIGTPESVVAMIIDGVFKTRFHNPGRYAGYKELFRHVLEQRMYSPGDISQIIKNSKSDGLEFYIESTIKYEGYDRPNFRDIARAISNYTFTYPDLGKW